MKEPFANRLLVIQQYIYDVERWGRQLAFQQEELVHFRNRLSEMIPASENEDVLQQAEIFHEEFMSQEKIITYLKEELKIQNLLLHKNPGQNRDMVDDVKIGQQKLVKEMTKSEELFTDVRKRFTEYLADQIL